MCLNTGTPKNIDFSFETNGKLTALGVPILKHFRVIFTVAREMNLILRASIKYPDQVCGLIRVFVFFLRIHVL